MIEEVIVVEGKNDVTAVKRAVDCECLITHGHGFLDELFDRLEEIQARRGIIVLTDPDYAGKKIRRRIQERIPQAKMAYLPRSAAIKGDDIGVENASVEAIREALKKARASLSERREEFTLEDLIRYGLSSGPGAREKRALLGKELHIGYGNAKQLTSRLNAYGIERDEFLLALAKIEKRKEEEKG